MPVSYEERTLLSLPVRSGGLNIINPVTSASGKYHASQKISEPLREIIVEQKESSSWLSFLPLQNQGFNLNKGVFWHAISLRYGWQLKNVPHHCKCGKNFSADHAIICPYGGLPMSRPNEIRDITSKWLTEVCTDVEK